MKKLSIVYSLFLPVLVFGQAPAELDSIVTTFDKLNFFHGTVLVAKDGKILLNKGYGFADVSSKKQNSPDLVYQVGSVTKQFTAAAILKLQEQKKLLLTDKLSRYFPSFKNGDKITIHHLLTHTSGIYNYTNDTAFWMRETARPSSQKQMMARFANKPLDFKPETEYRYSNSGYVLLGFIIEKVSGKTYEQFIRQNIFQPLGMSQSGFDFTKATNPANGYYDNGVANIPAFIVDSTASYAAGSIYTTTTDLFKWVQALHQKKIIKPESWKRAFTPFKDNYAYGLIVQGNGDSTVIGHGGGIHGFTSNLVYFPAKNLVIILLSNYMESKLANLTNTLASALFNKPYKLPTARTEISLSSATLQHYVGNYQLVPGFAITITVENGNLMAQATGQDKFPLFAEREDIFFYKVVDAQIKFEKGTDGAVKNLILYQNGMELKGEKVK